MNDTKRLTLPILIILGSALLVKLIDRFVVFTFTPTIITLLIVGALFFFGMVLNKSRKRSPAVFKKVVAILVVVLLMLMQMGYFTLPFISSTFDYFGIDGFFLNMIYIYCGYLFAD